MDFEGIINYLQILYELLFFLEDIRNYFIVMVSFYFNFSFLYIRYKF